MNKYPHLLSPGKLGNLELKNHIIMGPTETLYASCNGEVTRPIIDYYVRRAKGGVGLIVLHSAQGNTKIDPIDPYAGSLRMDDNAYIPMLSVLTEEVHRAGAKIAALVSPGGGAQALGFPYDKGSQGVHQVSNVGPSEKRSMVAQRPVRKLTVEEIQKSVEAYGLCAGRAKASGFDAFYIHAVGGYLASQFLTPYFNDRDDEYGGSLENRMRFLLELIASCQKHAGKDFPIIVRISIDEYMGDAGRGIEESKEIARRLEAAGVAAIDCSAGIFESMHMLIPPLYLPEGVLVPLAQTIKGVVNIPVITQGRLYDPVVAEGVLADGKADFVLLSRALVCDPDWVKKIQKDDAPSIRRCLTCNHCIGTRVFNNLPIRCAFNPEAGRESQSRSGLPKPESIKKVAIIGAGPSGLEAAYILGLRGHHVDIYEATDKLCGGQLDIAMVPPCKDVLKHIPGYFGEQLSRMENVKIHYNHPITESNMDSIHADVVLLATGAKALIPNIAGIDNLNIYTAEQVLKGDIYLSGNIAIAGGGQVGCETAHYLLENGCKVSIIEMLSAIALKEELITMLTITNILNSSGAEIYTDTKILEFKSDSVETVNVKTNESVSIPCDSIVLAFGTVPENALYEKLAEKFNVIKVGDCAKVGNVAAAIEDGYFAALEI